MRLTKTEFKRLEGIAEVLVLHKYGPTTNTTRPREIRLTLNGDGLVISHQDRGEYSFIETILTWEQLEKIFPE